MNTKELLPFHLFRYKGKGNLINIDKMQAYIVDDKMYQFLEEAVRGDVTDLTQQMLMKLQNFGLLQEEIENKKPSLPQDQNPITSMSLLVTRACNLRCVYCYEDKTGEKMDEKTALLAVDWLIEKSGDMRSIRIVFFGGEPLLNYPLIKTVVEYSLKKVHMANKNVSFSITTNGTLLDDEIIHFLQGHNIKTMISFDGTRELQNSQRPFKSGNDSYDIILPKIKNLLKIIPQAMGHAVVMGNTSPDIVMDELQNIGFEKVSFAMNSQSLFTDNAPVKEASGRDAQSLLLALEKEAELWHEKIRERNISDLHKLAGRSYLYGALLSLLNNTKKRYFCGAGRSMASVTPSGDIYLCHRFAGLNEYRIGDIYSSNLDMGSFSQSQIDTNDICSTCFAKYYCGGGCKHDHVSSWQSIDQPKPQMCKIRRLELELAAVLTSQLANEEKIFLVKENIFPPKPCPLDF